jgi:hypothetical protein
MFGLPSELSDPKAASRFACRRSPKQLLPELTFPSKTSLCASKTKPRGVMFPRAAV